MIKFSIKQVWSELPVFEWSNDEQRQFLLWLIAMFLLGVLYGITGVAIYFVFFL